MKVVILRGISGSGKSTYASKHYPNAVVCSADNFFQEGRYYNFDVTKLAEAHNECMSRFITLVSKGETQGISCVVVDNTNIHRWEYENYAKLAAAFKCEVEIVEFVPQTIEAVKRCIRRNVHRVPAEIIARMAVEFEPSPNATVVKII